MCSSASSQLCSIEVFIPWSISITEITREWSCQYKIMPLKEKGNIPRVQCLCPFDYCSVNIFFFVRLIFFSLFLHISVRSSLGPSECDYLPFCTEEEIHFQPRCCCQQPQFSHFYLCDEELGLYHSCSKHILRINCLQLHAGTCEGEAGFAVSPCQKTGTL